MTTVTSTITRLCLFCLLSLCCLIAVSLADDRLGLPGTGGDPDAADPEDQIGDGVSEFKDVMDNCSFAALRPVNGVSSPGRTNNATVDDVNGGFCGVDINTPGIWWKVNGTGDIVRASSCHQNTNIKTKISIFKGESCGDLECITGTQRDDFECALLQEPNEPWNTKSTAVDFPTVEGHMYYILVQQADPNDRGDVWMSYRTPEIPPNDNCFDAVGPVPRDNTRIEATTRDARISGVSAGYCHQADVPALYPGVWFQIMGTGGSITLSACGQTNINGFGFSVYNGAYCDNLQCVSGSFDYNVDGDAEKCTFSGSNINAESFIRPITTYTFNTRDRDRYYIYVHWAETAEPRPTGRFRFYVDDGQDGKAGSAGHHLITFEESTFINADGTIEGSNGQGGSSNSQSNGGNSNGNISAASTVPTSLVIVVIICLTSYLM